VAPKGVVGRKGGAREKVLEKKATQAKYDRAKKTKGKKEVQRSPAAIRGHMKQKQMKKTRRIIGNTKAIEQEGRVKSREKNRRHWE